MPICLIELQICLKCLECCWNRENNNVDWQTGVAKLCCSRSSPLPSRTLTMQAHSPALCQFTAPNQINVCPSPFPSLSLTHKQICWFSPSPSRALIRSLLCFSSVYLLAPFCRSCIFLKPSYLFALFSHDSSGISFLLFSVFGWKHSRRQHSLSDSS